MSQQNLKSEILFFKRRLFIDIGTNNRIEFASSTGLTANGNSKIGRIVEEYVPPSPSFKTSEIKVLNSTSIIHSTGKASYNIMIRIIMDDIKLLKKFFTYLAYLIIFYDELGGVYYCNVAPEKPEIRRYECGTRYEIKLNLIGVKKDSIERPKAVLFSDIDDIFISENGVLFENDITEMATLGLVESTDGGGNPVTTFRSNSPANRAEAVQVIYNLIQYFNKLMRG